MANKTILITGGAGFLGSHLCDAFIKKGYKVISVDNFSTGSSGNIAHLDGSPRFRFVKHDICKPLPKSVTDEKISFIANLASPASPPVYQQLAVETLDVGSLGVKNMLDLAKKNGARFFQASTSEVYGDPDISPQPETYKGSVNSYGPRSMYDESKRFAEALIYVYRNQLKVNTVIGRIFNTYGPRMDKDDGRVVSNFIIQAITGKPLTIYGDGKQTRSFCYVDDLIQSIVLLIESKEAGPINIGNPNEFTILDLANKILGLTNSKSSLVNQPLPGDDPTQRRPDIKLAKAKLNWEPKIELDEGIVKTVSYFSNVLKG